MLHELKAPTTSQAHRGDGTAQVDDPETGITNPTERALVSHQPPDPSQQWLATGDELKFCEELATPPSCSCKKLRNIARLPTKATDAIAQRLISHLNGQSTNYRTSAEGVMVLAESIQGKNQPAAFRLFEAVIIKARADHDNRLMGEAMLGLLRAHQPTSCDSNAKVIGYCEAFEALFPDKDPAAVDAHTQDTLRKVASDAETFLDLIATTRHWALGAPWVRFFSKASRDLTPTPEANTVAESALQKRSAELLETISKISPERLDPNRIKHDIDFLLIDAKEKSTKENFAQAELLLQGGLKRLGITGNHLYCAPQYTALMVRLAIARVENFLAEHMNDEEVRRLLPSSIAGTRETSDNSAITNELVEGLSYFSSQLNVPREVSGPLAKLLSNRDLRQWLNTSSLRQQG